MPENRSISPETTAANSSRALAFFLLLPALALAGCERKQSPAKPALTETSESPQTATAPPSTTKPDGWNPMESLAPDQWAPTASAAEVAWDGSERILTIGPGNDLNGVRWTGPLPTPPYTIELEAMRVAGSDFFCGLTFPVRSPEECVTFIVGGWGGNLVGISSIDGLDASENSTGTALEFEDNRWYRIRVDVRADRLDAWIDDKQVIEEFIEGRKLSLRPGPIDECAPLGLATWGTAATLRGIRWKKIEE